MTVINRLNQQALFRFSWHDGGSQASPLKQRLTRVDPESTAHRFTVATVTLLRKEGPDPEFKELFWILSLGPPPRMTLLLVR